MPVKKISFSRELIFIIVIVICILLACFMIYLQYGALNKVQQSIISEGQTITQLQTRLITLQRLKDQYPEFQEKLALYETMMPSASNEDTILTSIQGTANATNTNFLQIRFESQIPKEQYVEIPVKISFQGEYQQLVVLLEKVQNSQRAFRVDELRISQEQQANQQLGIKAEISASAFYITEQKKQEAKNEAVGLNK